MSNTTPFESSSSSCIFSTHRQCLLSSNSTSHQILIHLPGIIPSLYPPIYPWEGLVVSLFIHIVHLIFILPTRIWRIYIPLPSVPGVNIEILLSLFPCFSPGNFFDFILVMPRISFTQRHPTLAARYPARYLGHFPISSIYCTICPSFLFHRWRTVSLRFTTFRHHAVIAYLCTGGI